ncbi:MULTISPECIES: sensor histidine kinase [Niveibacterium]|uniref:histidine kinase n=1 Tax=Niveibacterium microcysteis TaxID=2811415 RepID=A0ABX7M9Y8_9RHOO|nr:MULTISPECIES: histidine kinase [Niveibacterium]QSI76307.1 histidine kinase [Niveibacterium microcysteis]
MKPCTRTPVPPRHYLQELPLLLVFNTVFAALWTTVSGSGFGEALVYSQCIGGLCYLSSIPIRYIRYPALKFAWGIAGGALGVVGGMMLATALRGHPATAALTQSPYAWRLTFGFSAVAFALCFAFFWWREVAERRSAELAARAAQADAARTEAERAAASAQLAALQAQIEPHFLFNTLANLRSLIGRDPELARTLLDRLIEWLRATLQASRTPHTTLAAEFELLSAYLDIQRIRMGGRLTVETRVAPALRELQLPPLLLQPLVENAIAHGIEQKAGPAHIALLAELRDGRVRLAVTDNGVGLGASNTQGTGLGLENVQARLASCFGDDARLSVESAPGGGVCASIEIPADRAGVHA